MSEVVGSVAFQALVLTLNTSEAGSSNSEVGSISLPTHPNAMTTLKVMMALKPCSCVMCYWAEDFLSKLAGITCNTHLLGTIVFTETLERISTMKSKLCTNLRLFYLDTSSSIGLFWKINKINT